MRTAMRWTALLAALLLWSAATTAGAQSSADSETEALAEARRGLAARRDGRDEEARQAFERSLALAPRASVRAQLGFALQALGRWVEAEATLAAAAELDDPWIERHRATLDTSLAEVRAHLGTLILSVVPADATLRIDGVPTPVDVPTRLPAGSVTISVQREGYYGTERVVVVRAGDTLRESFELRAREAESPPPSDTRVVSVGPTVVPETGPPLDVTPPDAVVEPTPDLDIDLRHWGGPTLTMGVGALGLGAGFALLAGRDSALAALLSHGCVETPTEYVCAPSGAMDASASHADAETFAATSTAALAAGGALLAIGGVWLLVEGLRPPSTRSDGVRVGPTGVQWTF